MTGILLSTVQKIKKTIELAADILKYINKHQIFLSNFSLVAGGGENPSLKVRRQRCEQF